MVIIYSDLYSLLWNYYKLCIIIVVIVKIYIKHLYTKVEHLRLYLINKGFTIIDESFIKDKNKYYPIIVAKYSGAVSKLTSTQIKYGPIILIKKEDDFIDYLNDRLVHLNNICKNNQKLLNEIKEIEEIMKDETCGNN